MIATLVIDLDGPLLNGMQRHYQCYSEILDEHGATPIPIEQYWELKRNRVDRTQLLEMSSAAPLYEKFLDLWIQRIETKKYLALDRLQHGAVDVLGNWKRSEMRLLLATMRNNRENLQWQIERLGIDSFFDEVLVAGTEHGSAGKAALVGDKLKGIDVNRILWVGDTEIDVYAARELGVRVGALTCGLRTGDFLSSLHPDFMENDLQSFADTLTRNCR